MNRRQAMKKVAVIFGASMSASTLLVFQQGCQTGDKRQPGIFNDKDAEMLNRIGEIIIPQTDTPGAAAVNTGGFAITMLEDCYPREARIKVTGFLSENLSGFEGMSMEDQTRKIGEIDAMVYGGNDGSQQQDFEGYKIIKELTLFGYFTSEAGMTEALDYVEIPGRYEGCLDLKPGQKAWA